MKCPLCGEELWDAGDAEYSVQCTNEACYFGENRQKFFGSEELFEEYAKTKQALDVAIKGLKDTKQCLQYLHTWDDYVDIADEDITKTLDQIKQITERKDVK